MTKELKVGQARYGGNKRKYFKLKDGDSTFRILPPIGDLAEDGRWSVFYSVHYGYQNSKKQGRAFLSSLIKNRKTGMIESPDAALERIQVLKAQLETAKKAKDTATVQKLLEYVGGPKSRYNLDSNHYMNVMDEQGNIGVLKIRHRAKLALDATIKKLRDKNVDPLSLDNGRFFVFNRTGSGPETVYQVSVKSNTINVDGVGEVNKEVVHKLNDSDLKRLSTEAAELDKLFKKLTSEQVTRIVKEGPAAVDEILDAKNDKSEATAEEEPAFDDEYGLEEQAEAATTPAAAPVAAPTTTTAPAAAALASAQTLAEPPKSTAQKISDMSVEDFLKTLDV